MKDFQRGWKTFSGQGSTRQYNGKQRKWLPEPAFRPHKKSWLVEHNNWVFLLPTVVFFVWYQVYPIVRVVWISFTDYKYLTNDPANWVGFDNYIEAGDPLMWDSLGQAAYFTAMFLPGTIIIPCYLQFLLMGFRISALLHLPGDSADSSGNSKYACICTLEVDVQLPDWTNQPLFGRSDRLVHLPQRPTVARWNWSDTTFCRDHGGLVGIGLPRRLFPSRTSSHP